METNENSPTTMTEILIETWGNRLHNFIDVIDIGEEIHLRGDNGRVTVLAVDPTNVEMVAAEWFPNHADFDDFHIGLNTGILKHRAKLVRKGRGRSAGDSVSLAIDDDSIELRQYRDNRRVSVTNHIPTLETASVRDEPDLEPGEMMGYGRPTAVLNADDLLILRDFLKNVNRSGGSSENVKSESLDIEMTEGNHRNKFEDLRLRTRGDEGDDSHIKFRNCVRDASPDDTDKIGPVGCVFSSDYLMDIATTLRSIRPDETRLTFGPIPGSNQDYPLVWSFTSSDPDVEPTSDDGVFLQGTFALAPRIGK